MARNCSDDSSSVDVGRIVLETYLRHVTDKLTFSGQQYTVTGKTHLFVWKVLANMF